MTISKKQHPAQRREKCKEKTGEFSLHPKLAAFAQSTAKTSAFSAPLLLCARFFHA